MPHFARPPPTYRARGEMDCKLHELPSVRTSFSCRKKPHFALATHLKMTRDGTELLQPGPIVKDNVC